MSKAIHRIFPIYTQVAERPLTIFKAVHPSVFDAPFFNQGYESGRQLSSDKNIYEFKDLPMVNEGELLALKGFIFHTSHCGSTLLGRMLGRLPGVRVVAETEAINGLLLSYALYNLPENEVLTHLKHIMEAYRQPLKDEKFLVFKLTSWNVFFIRLFRQLYPAVPWIYLDRDTGEVVNSLLTKGRGFADWWNHPADILRRYFTGKEIDCSSKENYLKQMVERHRFFAQSNINEHACFLHYPEWIGQFERVILPHFGLHFSKDDIQDAIQASRYESKKADPILFTPS